MNVILTFWREMTRELIHIVWLDTDGLTEHYLNVIIFISLLILQHIENVLRLHN